MDDKVEVFGNVTGFAEIKQNKKTNKLIKLKLKL